MRKVPHTDIVSAEQLMDIALEVHKRTMFRSEKEEAEWRDRHPARHNDHTLRRDAQPYEKTIIATLEALMRRPRLLAELEKRAATLVAR